MGWLLWLVVVGWNGLESGLGVVRAESLFFGNGARYVCVSLENFVERDRYVGVTLGGDGEEEEEVRRICGWPPKSVRKDEPEEKAMNEERRDGRAQYENLLPCRPKDFSPHSLVEC